MSVADCGLCDGLKLMELLQVLGTEWAEGESRMAEACRLEEQMHDAEEHLKTLRLMCALFDEFGLSMCRWPLGQRTGKKGVTYLLLMFMN